MIPPPLWVDLVAFAAATIVMRRDLGQISAMDLGLSLTQDNEIWPSAKVRALGWPKEVVG